MAAFIPQTHFPTRRTNILYFVWFCVSSVQTGTRRMLCPDPLLSSVVRRSKLITKDSSSTCTMRISQATFILETRNPTKCKCFPKFVQTDNATIVSKRPQSHYPSGRIRRPLVYKRPNRELGDQEKVSFLIYSRRKRPNPWTDVKRKVKDDEWYHLDRQPTWLVH